MLYNLVSYTNAGGTNKYSQMLISKAYGTLLMSLYVKFEKNTQYNPLSTYYCYMYKISM